MKYKNITDDEFNNFTSEQLNRLIFVFYDGQGDQCCVTWDNFVETSEICSKEENRTFSTNVEKFNLIYEHNPFLNGNISDLLYFDYDNKYKRIYFNKKKL